MAENGRSRRDSGPKRKPTQIQDHRKNNIQDEEDLFEKMWEELENSEEDGANIDPDKFLREMDILDRLNPVPDFEMKSWEDVRKELAPLLGDPDSADQQSSASDLEKRPKRRRPKRSSFRNVIALVVIVAILLAVTACGPLVRFLQAIGVDTEDIFSFDVFQSLRVDEPKPEDTGIESYESLETALDACNINGASIPSWYPPGYSLNLVRIVDHPYSQKICAEYTSGTEKIVFTIWHYHDSTSLELQAAEKLPQDVEPYVRNGIEHYILENSDSTTTTWISGTEMYQVIGPISADQSKQMIDSIYER